MAEHFAGWVTFSPDGSKLAYNFTPTNLSVAPPGPEQIYVANLNTGTVVASSSLSFTLKTHTSESAITDAAVTFGTDGKSYINAAHYNGGATTLSGVAELGDQVVITDANGSSVGTVTANATTGAWSLALSGLKDGQSYAYTAKATDIASNTATGSIAFTIDATAPAVVIAGGAVTTTTPKLTIGGTGAIGTTVTLLDGTSQLGSPVPVDSTGHWSEAVTLTTSGVHTITAQDTDAAGNVGVSGPVSVTYSPAQPPTLTSPVLTSDGGGRSATILVSQNSVFASEPDSFVTQVSATDANAGHTVSYKIVGGADYDQFSIDPNTGVLTFQSTPDTGTYYVKVSAVDSASTGGTNLTATQTLTVKVGASRMNGDTAPNHDTFDIGHGVGSVKVGNVDFSRDTFVFDKTMFAYTNDLLAHAADVVVQGQDFDADHLQCPGRTTRGTRPDHAHRYQPFGLQGRPAHSPVRLPLRMSDVPGTIAPRLWVKFFSWALPKRDFSWRPWPQAATPLMLMGSEKATLSIGAQTEPRIGVGPWGQTVGPARIDHRAGLSKDGSPWPSTAHTASNSSARSLRSFSQARPCMGSPSVMTSAAT